MRISAGCSGLRIMRVSRIGVRLPALVNQGVRKEARVERKAKAADRGRPRAASEEPLI